MYKLTLKETIRFFEFAISASGKLCVSIENNEKVIKKTEMISGENREKLKTEYERLKLLLIKESELTI